MLLLLLFIALTVLFGACSRRLVSVPEPADGAPGELIDVLAIPDAVPRPEPRSRYGNPPHYEVFGNRYYVRKSSHGYRNRGIASWYGRKFHGRRTSSGETYDMFAMTAAHKTLPLPTYARVRNLRNGRRVVVKINDRGPFHPNRIIDLSYAAAVKLGIVGEGTGLVEVEAITPGNREPPSPSPRISDPPAATARLKPLVATPREPSAPASSLQQSAPGSAPEPRFAIYLQVGAFANRRNAERLREQIADPLLPRVHVQEAAVNEQSVFRVRLGPIPNVEEVDRVAEVLTTLGILDSHVVID
jgi:rare lipoprotein A